MSLLGSRITQVSGAAQIPLLDAGYNVSTQFCCTTVGLSLTARTDSHTKLSSFSGNF